MNIQKEISYLLVLSSVSVSFSVDDEVEDIYSYSSFSVGVTTKENGDWWISSASFPFPKSKKTNYAKMNISGNGSDSASPSSSSMQSNGEEKQEYTEITNSIEFLFKEIVKGVVIFVGVIFFVYITILIVVQVVIIIMQLLEIICNIIGLFLLAGIACSTENVLRNTMEFSSGSDSRKKGIFQ